jgi:intein/homing endonuclease
LEKIIKKKYPDGADRMEIVEFIDKYMDKKAQVLARDRLDNWYSYTMNSYLPEKLQLDREIISDCLPFETKVETQYGPRDIGLVAKNPEQYLVISTDKDGNKSYKKVINSKKSKHKRKLIKLIFPDGKELVCTPNHEVAYLENGQIKYKRAIEITETDDVFIEG